MPDVKDKLQEAAAILRWLSQCEGDCERKRKLSWPATEVDEIITCIAVAENRANDSLG